MRYSERLSGNISFTSAWHNRRALKFAAFSHSDSWLPRSDTSSAKNKRVGNPVSLSPGELPYKRVIAPHVEANVGSERPELPANIREGRKLFRRKKVLSLSTVLFAFLLPLTSNF